MTANFKDSLPGELIKHVKAICGRKGEAWLENLPQIIAHLEDDWTIRVEEPFPGGEYNFVAKAVGEDGIKAVVKAAPPYERTEIYSEAQYLRVRDGESAIRLLAEDRDRKAILLEFASPGQALFEHYSDDPLASVDAAINVLQAILRPPPAEPEDVQFLDIWFERFQKGHKHTDFPRAAARNALAIYGKLSAQPGRTYYLHGDFHPGNIVTSNRQRFLAIDPKGLIGHIGYDIAVFLNNLHWWQKNTEDVEELLAEAIVRFARSFSMDETDLREWAYATMVIGAWWNLKDMPEHYEGDSALSDIWGI